MTKKTSAAGRIMAAIVLAVTVLCQGLSAYALVLPSDDTEAYLRYAVDEYVAEHKDSIAAMSVSVFTADGVILEKSYGFANIAESVPNDADTVLEWGSVTKLLTWVSVMQLVEQGRLDLDADIREYLPEGFLRKLKFDDKITMLNLMNHNAGWQEAFVGMALPDGSRARELAETLKITEPAQIYRPGETVAYSNFGATLAGYIVERIAGIPFYQYVRENIFEPLGMDKTAIKPDWSDNPWVQAQRKKIHCYDGRLNDLGLANANIQDYCAGSACGTIADLRKFGQALLPGENGGSPLFASPDTTALMYSPTLYYPGETKAEICHGFWLDEQDLIGHGGNTLGFSSLLKFDPAAGIGVAVVVNKAGESSDLDGIAGLVFGDKYGEVQGKPVDAEAFSGIYSSSRSIKTGGLKLYDLINVIAIPAKDGVFTELAPGVYELTDGGYILRSVSFDENGKAQKMSTMYVELTRVSGLQYAFRMATVVLYALAVLYCVAGLVVWIVGAVRRKKYPTAKTRLAVYLAVILSALSAVHLLGTMTSFNFAYEFFAARGILFALTAAVPVVYAVLLVIRWKKLGADKRQRIWLAVTAIMGLIVSFNILFWQLWMFWAY